MTDPAACIAAAVSVFERAGAGVHIDPEGENLIRQESGRWVVHAQGLPNLIHELVHFLGSGRVDDDYGFPYGEVPLNLERADHRALLWEELCCCTFSMPYASEPEAWFEEQVGILPVFYGDGDWAAWARSVEGTMCVHGAEFEAAREVLFQRLQHALGQAFEPPAGFATAWAGLRRRTDATNEAGGETDA